jgi:hypothetical protein
VLLAHRTPQAPLLLLLLVLLLGRQWHEASS